MVTKKRERLQTAAEYDFPIAATKSDALKFLERNNATFELCFLLI
jgi:hypothetical protein